MANWQIAAQRIVTLIGANLTNNPAKIQHLRHFFVLVYCIFVCKALFIFDTTGLSYTKMAESQSTATEIYDLVLRLNSLRKF